VAAGGSDTELRERKRTKKERITMRKESVERMAREKAEHAAMQEAMANNVVIWLPLAFVAFVAMLGGAPAQITTLFLVAALCAGVIASLLTWKKAYAKYYEKYLADLNALLVEGSKHET